jgi:hypothetical protein
MGLLKALAFAVKAGLEAAETAAKGDADRSRQLAALHQDLAEVALKHAEVLDLNGDDAENLVHTRAGGPKTP